METMDTQLTNPLPEPDSDDNADRALHWFGIITNHGRLTLEAAARLGEVLIEQRDLCQQDGETFLEWIESDMPFSRASAYRYIEVAEKWEHIEERLSYCETPVSDVSIRGALQLVAGPKVRAPKTSQIAPFRADAGSPAPEPDHFPDATKMVEEPTTDGPVGTDAPLLPADDATALAFDLTKLQRRVAQLDVCVGGQNFDSKLAVRHVECATALVHGDSPDYRLMPWSDIASQAAELFDIYPRRVARDKGLVAIRKALKEVDFEYLREAVSEYAASRIGKDEQFTPHPATWFGEGRWADDRADWFRDERRKGERPREPWEHHGSRQNNTDGVF